MDENASAELAAFIGSIKDEWEWPQSNHNDSTDFEVYAYEHNKITPYCGAMFNLFAEDNGSTRLHAFINKKWMQIEEQFEIKFKLDEDNWMQCQIDNIEKVKDIHGNIIDVNIEDFVSLVECAIKLETSGANTLRLQQEISYYILEDSFEKEQKAVDKKASTDKQDPVRMGTNLINTWTKLQQLIEHALTLA